LNTTDVKDSFYGELGCAFDQFPKHNMKTLLADFNVKVGREDIFTLIIGNECSHKISNDNGVTAVRLVVKSTMFPAS
jgi:hypothetical protein